MFIQGPAPGVLSALLFLLQLLTFPVLFVARAVLLLSLLLLHGVLAYLITLGTDEARPLRGARKRLAVATYAAINRGFFLVLGIRVRRRGRLDGRARVVVCNHTSILDTFAGPAVLYASPVVKRGRYPWAIRQMLRMARAVIYDRDYRRGEKEQRGSADRATHAVRDQIKQRLAHFDIPVVLFPEGSIVDPAYMLRFRPFSFTLGARMQILTFRYRLTMHIPWTCQSGWALLLQHVMCWGGVLDAEFGESLQIDDAEGVCGAVDQWSGEGKIIKSQKS